MRLRTAKDRLKIEHSIIDGVRGILEELLKATPAIRSVIPGVIRPVRDARGQLKLWIGGTANKNKDVFEQRFRELTEQIESELKILSQTGAEASVIALAGK